jgi:hypothetical protein
MWKHFWYITESFDACVGRSWLYKRFRFHCTGLYEGKSPSYNSRGGFHFQNYVRRSWLYMILTLRDLLLVDELGFHFQILGSSDLKMEVEVPVDW